MNKLLKNTSLYTIGNIIPQIANFFLLPVYTAYLTASDYGIVQSMQVLSVILTIFFTLAVDRAVYRLYFDFKTEENKKTYISTIAISLFSISILVLALLFLFNNLISKIYSSIPFYPFYFYAIITAFLTTYALLPKIYYQVNEKAGRFISLSLLQFIANTGFVLWFVVGINAGAVGWLKGLMLGNLITLPVFIWVMIKTINFKFNFTYLKNSLKYSLPIIPALLSAWILNLSDRIFIEHYFSMKEVGIYSLGYKIAGLVLIISSAFRLAYNPVFFKLANSDDQVQAKKKLSKYNYTYIVIIIIVVFCITFFAKEFLQLFFKPAYFESYKIVYLISLAYLISQVAGLFNLSIYQKKKTVVVMFIVLGSAAINILLNFLLIPVYGIYGAAYATILSFLVFALVKFVFAKKYYYIKTNWGWLFIILAGLIGTEVLFSLISLQPIYMLILKSVIILMVLFFMYHYYFDKIKAIIKDNL